MNRFLLFILWISYLFFVNADNFTIVILPDTQYYSAYFPINNLYQAYWTCKCKEEYNIRFVIHEGDLVEHGNQYSKEWDSIRNVYNYLSKCDLSLSVLPGNHDEDSQAISNDRYMYQDFFQESVLKQSPYYKGSFKEGDTSNTYYIVQIDATTQLLMINIEYLPNSKNVTYVMDWTIHLIEIYQNMSIIITSHYVADGCFNDVYPFFQQLGNQYCNILFITGGHVIDCTENTIVLTNQCNKPTYIFVTNFQTLAEGGLTWLRYYTFNKTLTGGYNICAKTYSPLLRSYKTDSLSSFSFNTENFNIENACETKQCDISSIIFIHKLNTISVSVICVLFLYLKP